MRIFWIITKGLKCLRSCELTGLEDLSTYNVLIGPNNAGKSTLLESIELLRAIVKQIPVDGIYSRDPPADRIAFEVGMELSPSEVTALAKEVGVSEVPNELLDSLCRWSFLFEIRSDAPQWPQGQAGLRRWWLVSHRECYEMGSVTHDQSWTSQYYDLRRGLVLSVAQQPLVPIRDLVPTLEKKSSGHNMPPLSPEGNHLDNLGEMIRRQANKIRRLDSARVPRDWHRMESVGREANLAANAENLVAFLHVYFSHRPSERYEFNREFERILSDLHGFLDPVVGNDVRLKIAPKPDAAAEESYDLRNVGGAARQVLCILAFVWTAEEGDILLIEEPELNLHPSAQRRLSTFLLHRARDRNLQIVLSTHSTLFARRGPDCRTYLVTLDPERGTVVRLLEEQELGDSCAVLGMRHVYIFGYDVCLLLHGDSEEGAMPLLIKAVASVKGVDPDDLGIWPVNLLGTPPKKAVEAYLNYIHGSPVTPYVVLDDDQGMREFVEGLVKQGLVSKTHYHIWEGRSRQGRPVTVGSEFEDNFTNEQLISAANQLAEAEYEQEEMAGKLLVGEFRRRLKGSTVKTSQVLQKYYIEVFGTRGWSKPALNEILARQLAERIREGETPEHARELIEVCQKVIEVAQAASQTLTDS